jgi:hypothetical protein
MNHQAYTPAVTPVTQLLAALESFDGACDPAFDNGQDELERQFAEYRLTLATE